MAETLQTVTFKTQHGVIVVPANLAAIAVYWWTYEDHKAVFDLNDLTVEDYVDVLAVDNYSKDMILSYLNDFEYA